jgi:tetratricopeptide (TPR) repeat protein
MDSPSRYRAFISYSHGDEKWARWLHRRLETYRLPKHLVGTATEFGTVPQRFAPVFRDREELATATDLGSTLVAALEQSACLVVICSPAAAKSRWVNEEILTFKRLGREDRIFCLIVDGEPGASLDPANAESECFPPALIRKMGADGELTAERGEPIAADARPRKDRRHTAMLKLLAGMLGIGLDELKRRDATRRRRRLIGLVAASFAGMLITSALAVTAWLARNEADRQRVEAERQRAQAQRDAQTARQVTGFIVDLFKVYDPGEASGNETKARELLDRGAVRIHSELDGQPAVQATLLDTLGAAYKNLGLYPEAVALGRESVESRRSLPGDRRVEVARSTSQLGEVLGLSGDYEEASARLTDALAVQRRVLGDAHADVADTLSALADVKSFAGDPDAGRPLIEEALAIRRRLHGEVDPGVASSLGDLGVNFGERGDFRQAETYLRQSLALQRKLHPEAHPELDEAMNNLAWALEGLGKFVEAEALHRESLAMKRRLFPDPHPLLAVGLNNVAYDLEMRGDYRGAEKAYRESLEMSRKIQAGRDHRDIATGMSNLAFVLDARGDRRAAIRMLRDSVEMRRRVLGPDHPDVAGGETSLAYWLTSTGEYKEAERLLVEALAIRRKALGDEHPRVGGTLATQANLRLAQGRHREALAEATEALRILLLNLPGDHWQVAMTENIRGAALAGLGRYGEAEKLLLASLPNLEGSPIPDLPQRGRERLAALYEAWGKPEEAARYDR